MRRRKPKLHKISNTQKNNPLIELPLEFRVGGYDLKLTSESTPSAIPYDVAATLSTVGYMHALGLLSQTPTPQSGYASHSGHADMVPDFVSQGENRIRGLRAPGLAALALMAALYGAKPCNAATQPNILAAGYMGTSVTSNEGGTVTMAAITNGNNHKVKVFYQGIDTGLELPVAGDGFHTVSIPLDPLATGPLSLTLEMLASGDSMHSNVWPYLTVDAQVTPTPTSTSTSTPTQSPTNTATNSPTRTHTQPPTATLTLTPTNSPSGTPTGTPTTVTVTPTPSNTPTQGPTSTYTLTPTPTSTGTNTPTGTVTLTPTYTRTSTPTFTLTYTPTPTASPTESPTPSATNSPTQTYTFTMTPTPSPSYTSVPTRTPTPTPRPPPWTSTPTQSPTPDPTPTDSTRAYLNQLLRDCTNRQHADPSLYALSRHNMPFDRQRPFTTYLARQNIIGRR